MDLTCFFTPLEHIKTNFLNSLPFQNGKNPRKVRALLVDDLLEKIDPRNHQYNLINMNSQREPKKVPNGSLVIMKERRVSYKECRRNHAASIGGYAVDGCREFMAAGEEGTSDSLKCAACGCHRSFHRREVENDYVSDSSSTSTSPR